jgi:hypothetical protein
MLLVSTAFWMGWGEPDERVSSRGSRQYRRPGDPTHDMAERSWGVAEVHFSCLDGGLVADVRNVNAANPAATICAHAEAQDHFCALGTKLIKPAVTCGYSARGDGRAEHRAAIQELTSVGRMDEFKRQSPRFSAMLKGSPPEPQLLNIVAVHDHRAGRCGASTSVARPV